VTAAYRVGSHQPRNVYRIADEAAGENDDFYLGVMVSPAWGAIAVRSLNVFAGARALPGDTSHGSPFTVRATHNLFFRGVQIGFYFARADAEHVADALNYHQQLHPDHIDDLMGPAL